MSELKRARLRVLGREKAALDTLARVGVAEAIADPRPAVPIADAFAAVRARVICDPARAGNEPS